MMEFELRERFGEKAVSVLLERIHSGQSPEIDPAYFDQILIDAGLVGVKAVELLDAAADASLVERVDAWRCPVEICRRIIDEYAASNHECPYCNTDYRELGENPVKFTLYRAATVNSRSAPWLIAVHGFNTRGNWQEDFGWRIANRFKYHAPVLIYKYGLVRLGVLFRRRHRELSNQLGVKLRTAITHARKNQITEPPDVVIHSFGSQLFRLILESSEFSDLRFGRVIAVGSVIRPDFDWSHYISIGRVESVISHCGAKDCAVPFAQFTIPGTGPAGRHGFTSPSAFNVRSSEYGHSTAFLEDELAKNLSDGGLWERYLRLPLASFSDPMEFSPKPWFPSNAFLRNSLHVLVVLIVSALLLAMSAITLLGVRELFRLLW